MPLPNPIIHVNQLADGYCLAACAEMALLQWGIQTTQKQLASLLNIRPGFGTPFSSIRAITRYGVDLQIFSWQGIEVLKKSLDTPNAIAIAAIVTIPAFVGWSQRSTQHVVLVTRVDSATVTYHDPALFTGPVQISVDEFMLAWIEMDEMVAVLQPKR